MFKGFFNTLKDELQSEITKQIGQQLQSGGGSGGGDGGSGGSGSSGGGGAMGILQGVLGLMGKGGGSGGGGGGNSLQQIGSIIEMIQGKSGGILPGNIGKYLPAILKLAEVIGHGMGDDSPRTEKNSDGSFIDDFVKTIIGGRKIHGGGKKETIKPLKPTDGTDGSFGSSGAVQDFETLRNECLSAGVLFEDPEFPAENSSVFFSKEGRRFEWLRPHKICGGDPSFFTDGATRFDVKQGELGDCWLLAAVANLTLNPALFHQIVPEDNSFQEGYAGIFHFRFWQYGEWVDVVVDDRLPTVNGKLMFMHSEDNSEFWSALLEKAYAKLHGSFEALKGGTTCEALEDFTGGVTEMYDLKTAPSTLLNMIIKAFERSSFLGCSIEPDPNKLEAETSMGLIRGHAYSITAVKMLDVETPRVSGKVPLLRIKNPWGNEVEWKGAWSDCSAEWQYIDDETKEEIGLTFDADGEFWMTFKDFMSHFDRLEFCNLSPDSIIEGEDENYGQKKWNMDIFHGAWISGESAGGCRNFIESFASNPQYVIDLVDPDEDDAEDKCTVIVALMQKNRRAQMKDGIDCLTIGFAIYPLKDDAPNPLPMEFFKYNASVARSPTFINLREVSSRFKLPAGRYVIVPSTFEPNDEGEFIIRVFTEGK